MTGSASLADSLKEHVKEVQEDIVRERFMVMSLENKIRDERQLLESAEAELAALTRRKRLLEEDLETSSSRLTEVSAKLEEASKSAEDSEHSYFEVYKQCNVLTAECLESKKIVEKTLSHHANMGVMHQELLEELAATENRRALCQNSVSSYQEQVKQYEANMKELASKIKSLQAENDACIADERELELHLSVQQKHVQEAESRAEAAESTVAHHEAEIRNVKSRVVSERETHDRLQNELDHMMQQLQSV